MEENTDNTDNTDKIISLTNKLLEADQDKLYKSRFDELSLYFADKTIKQQDSHQGAWEKTNFKDSVNSYFSSVMKISNLDENGNYVEDMYEVNNGEDNKPIYVTGSHLIYDTSISDFVEVKNLRGRNPSILSEKKCKELSCLITSDNTIPIGDWIFHDWEDKR